MDMNGLLDASVAAQYIRFIERDGLDSGAKSAKNTCA
jgi:hypothetical protein